LVAACSPQQTPHALNPVKQNQPPTQTNQKLNYPENISLALDTQLLFNTNYKGQRVVLPFQPKADFSTHSQKNTKQNTNNAQNTGSPPHNHETHPVSNGHHTGWDKNQISLDPQDPASLAQLYPNVPGNKNIPIPETQVAIISFNGMAPTPLQTGELMVKVAAPVSVNLEKIKRMYNATVLAGPDSEGAYLIRPDMTKVGLNQLEQNLKKLNQRISNANYIVRNVSFSNLESARTLAFFAELLTSSMAEGVGFNPLLSTALAKTYESTLKPNLNAEQSWWLNERSVNAIQAWEHTLGYNLQLDRSVKVAVLDTGFSGMWEHMGQGRDLEGQILYDQGFVLDYDDGTGQILSEKPWTPALLIAENGLDQFSNHGTIASSLIVSHINDRNGIAGIAPGAKVIPIKVGRPNWWAVRRGIELARQAGADIISMSLGGSTPDVFTLDYSALTQINAYRWYSSMQKELAYTNQKNIVLLAAAGNGGWDTQRGVFAGRLDDSQKRVFPELIVVGAVENDQHYLPGNDREQYKPFAFPLNLKRALFSGEYLEPPAPVNPNAATIREQMGINEWPTYLNRFYNATKTEIDKMNSPLGGTDLAGSNWGNIDIWLPGDSVDVLVKPGYEGRPLGLANENGTSLATPLAAGLVALMKARNIQINHTNANSFDALTLMQNPSNSIKNTHDDPYLRGFPQELSGAACGSLTNIQCGQVTPLKSIEELNPIPKKTTVQVPLAPLVVKAVPSATQEQAVSYQGKLIETADQLLLETTTGRYLLAMAGNRSSHFIKNFFGHDLQGEPVQISGLLQKDITVRGWLANNDLHILEVRQGQPSSQQCLNEEIITDTNWVWFKDQLRNRAVVVPHYVSEVDITPTQSGRSVLPIWSELTPTGHPYGEGRALCGACRYDFWYDYAVPTGYKVEEAKLEIQSDDEALFFVNQNYIGSADYGSTFGQNRPQIFDIPASYFNSPTNATIGVVFSTQATNGAIVPPFEAYNYAAVAAKISLKVCPQ